MKKLALSLSVFASTLCAQAHEQPTHAADTQLISQAITREASKQGSKSMITVPDTEKSAKAIEIGKKLSLLAGIDIPMRTVIDRSAPTAIGSLEIVLPSTGLAKFDDSQLPFVMAHELAHIILDHAAARIEMAVTACTPFPDPGHLLSCIQAQLGEKGEIREALDALNRRQELEADLWAAKFLAEHAIEADIAGALRAAHINAPWISRSHPSLSKRLEQINGFWEASAIQSPGGSH